MHNAYVGQTSGSINKRFNNHKSDIKSMRDSKEEQKTVIGLFANHGIDNINITTLLIGPHRLEHLFKNKMMIQYGIAYPHGLNTIFYHRNVPSDFRNSELQECIFSRISHYLRYSSYDVGYSASAEEATEAIINNTTGICKKSFKNCHL